MGRPATPALDPVFVALNRDELPVRARSGGELAERVRRAEDYAALGARVVVELHSESHAAKPSTRAWATAAAPTAATAATRTASSAATAAAPTAPPARIAPTSRRGRWLPMPADPIHPDQLDGEQRFRADLVAYLDSLPINELAELLDELPSNRQQPLGLGVLIIALNERLPDGYKLLPPAGHLDPGEGRRRSLRQVVADRRAARAAQHAGPPPSGLAEWLAHRQQQTDPHAERARAGAVGERRVAEALRTQAGVAGRQEHGDPPAEPPGRERDRQYEERDRQEQERDRESEGDFSDSWHSYRERAEHIRQTYGWRMPEPPQRVHPWLPLGRDDDQERDSDREDR
jgi:hypothetical protein